MGRGVECPKFVRFVTFINYSWNENPSYSAILGDWVYFWPKTGQYGHLGIYIYIGNLYYNSECI